MYQSIEADCAPLGVVSGTTVKQVSPGAVVLNARGDVGPCTTVVPKGAIGICLATTPHGPVLISTGTLSGRVPIGWLLVGLDEIDVGTSVASSITGRLKQREGSERTLRWRECTPAELATIGLTSIDVPAGRLGITISKAKDPQDDYGPRITEIADDSPLAAAAASLKGLTLLEIDGIDVSKCTADQAAAILKKHMDSPRRLKVLKTTGPSAGPTDLLEFTVDLVASMTM